MNNYSKYNIYYTISFEVASENDHILTINRHSLSVLYTQIDEVI